MEQLTQVNSPGEFANWVGGGARDLGGLAGYTSRQPRGAESTTRLVVLRECDTDRQWSEKNSHPPIPDEFPGWLRPYCDMCWDQWVWLPTCLTQASRVIGRRARLDNTQAGPSGPNRLPQHFRQTCRYGRKVMVTFASVLSWRY